MRVNGVSVDQVPAARRLLDFLRDDLGLTSPKEGCGMGECGACTVLVDGESVCSCLVLVGQVADKEVLTCEGLAVSALHTVQEALVREHGSQCGYCTPGIVVSLAALVEAHPHASNDDITDALAGNLCRCTGYASILRAAKAVIG